MCWDNPVSFWKHMMIFFSHLSLFNGWNILKIWENLSKWNMDVGPSHLRASYVLATYIYAHHVSYVRGPYASNVGDVPEYVCPVHICEAMRWLSHTWSGWDVFWEVHRITWLFSKKVWEIVGYYALSKPFLFKYNIINHIWLNNVYLIGI